MSDEMKRNVRRRLFRGALALFGAFLVARGGAGYAEGKFSKQTMHYRDRPNGRQACSNCSHFLPDGDPWRPGRCTVVAGGISRHGWCAVWTTRKPIEGC